MIEFKIDVGPFFERATSLNAAADQMPFALSRAINDAANETYDFLIEQTWPNAVKVRNNSFLRWALRTKFSTKYDLRIEIYDNTPDQRAHLALHAEGGIKTPKGKRIAVPTADVRLGVHGAYQNQRPGNLARKVVKGNLIFQASGRGKSQHLKLMYVLATKAKQPMDVPFQSDFERQMLEGAQRHFKQRMMQAMRTRR